MPAGVSWGQYLRYTTAAMLSMFAGMNLAYHGSQVVHSFYKPMADMDAYVKEELAKYEASQESEGTKSEIT